MGFRFWRRVRVAPGVTLNLSKAGGSLSFGGRGAHFTVGSRGKRATVGIPGTGLFYTTKLSSKPGRSRRRAVRGRDESADPELASADWAEPEVAPEDRLSLGFFQRLLTPKEEQALVDGCRELALGHEAAALEHMRNAAHLADGAYLAGMLALKAGREVEAIPYLKDAVARQRELGRYFSKYGFSAVTSLQIAEDVCVHVEPGLRGALLALVEAHQREGNWREAVGCLKRLTELEPDDVVVRLSLAELLMESAPPGKATWKRVIGLSRGIENDTPIHTALLLYKARALRLLGLLEAARDTLTTALRRRKDRPEHLLGALRYERGLVYEAMGQKRRARAEFEKLYAEDPDYEDVAARLGL